MNPVDSTPEMVAEVYRAIHDNLKIVRETLGRPLTLAEKILFAHLVKPDDPDLDRNPYLELRPDRIAMQDSAGPMALLQFMLAKKPRAAAPTTVHCDHLIQAKAGALPDLEIALRDNLETYEFLQTASQKFGMGFWKPGSGIIHQVVLEHYAFPGGLLLGTDSHTPNAGGLGMLAIGSGGSDAVDALAGLPWEVKRPTILGVRLTGELNGWTAPKDVILRLCGLLTTSGGTNHVIEYFGPGCATISCTGKATITNMGAELGATSSIFPYDDRMGEYLRATHRGPLSDLAQARTGELCADPEVEEHPERFFERVIEIDLSGLEPHVVGPHTPDLARPVSAMQQAVAEHEYPDHISAALIGSCTNSSYEDISRAADVARQASACGLTTRAPLFITPGSEQVRATIARDGQLAALESIGATVLANACGPCIGQWTRADIESGTSNSIITSFNRNFPKRNDGSQSTLSFIASPESVVAYALSGSLSFNPLTDGIEDDHGATFQLAPPEPAPHVPEKGFTVDTTGYLAPPKNSRDIEILLPPNSQRLARLEPFRPWHGGDFEKMPVLLKASGKTTTDHISPAGQWLALRGHLDKLSDNLFLGVKNEFSTEPGMGFNQVDNTPDQPLPEIAREYNARGIAWVVVGDWNYGEGSSREHAAMSPRYLGSVGIIARSYARIHETNLKKHGMLPLSFTNPKDYEKIRRDDQISILGLADIAPGLPLPIVIHHADSSKERIEVSHSLNLDQIAWFRAGSALNLLVQNSSRATP